MSEIGYRSEKQKSCVQFSSIDEIAASEGIHEIVTADGRVVRFVVGKGQRVSLEHKRLLVANAELNISLLPADQQPKMREHIEKIRKELENP